MLPLTMTSTEQTTEGYAELEALTLALLCQQLRQALESGEASASLIGTAVGMLRAGGVQQASTSQLRESSETSANWFDDLPEEAKAKLREGPAGAYIDKVESSDA